MTEAEPGPADRAGSRASTRSTRVNETIRERYWIDSTEPWYPPTQRRADSYRQLMHAQTRAGDMHLDDVTNRVLDVQEDYLASIGPQRTPAERLAQRERDRGHLRGRAEQPGVRAMTFAVAILEEAGKATPPEALMVALRSHKTIFVGDTRQLPPHIWDPMRDRAARPAAAHDREPASAGRGRSEMRARDRTARRAPRRSVKPPTSRRCSVTSLTPSTAPSTR